jgi:soluble lytic murein transglycosylase-like protein
VSTAAIAPTVGMPEDELAIAQRVRQLQALIEQARQVSTSGVATGPATAIASAGVPSAGISSAGISSQAPPGDFASALQAATAADSSSVAQSEGAAALGSASDGAGGAGVSSSEYDPMIEQTAERYGIEPAILHGLIQQESGFDPSAQSSAGASGLTQLMPGTAASLGVANPLNPTESIEGGARYLSQLMGQFGGNTTDALAAYNAGPGAVQQYGGVPPYAETQSYVSKVLGYAEVYRQAHGVPSYLGSPA